MCKDNFMLLGYNTSVQTYKRAKQVVIDRLCNGVVIKNAGNTLVVIQSDTLQPGESKSIGGNSGEVFIGRVDINFQLPAVIPVPVVNLVQVTQKFYTGQMIKLIP
jgi:hypothetical protein